MKDQKNAYFVVERKNVDNLTPATVVSLRAGMEVEKIPEYLPSLCRDYSWMNAKRFVHIFEDGKSSALFDSFGIENIRSGKPVDKYVAMFNPDDQAIVFFPLISERRKTVAMKDGWCKQ